jgi:hypothetical protein
MHEMNVLHVYVKSAQGERTYKTDAGIPFECVEFVRRYFMQTRGLTFPSVVDATDMFYRVHALIPLQTIQPIQTIQSIQTIQPSKSVELQTRVYPYVRNALHYLRPGTMLFWAPEPTDELKYGHVALIVESNAERVVVAQQNRSPPIQVHDTRALFSAINSPNSAYLGLKLVL